MMGCPLAVPYLTTDSGSMTAATQLFSDEP